MRKELKSFSVEYLQILDEKGALDKALLPKLSAAQMVSMYKTMVLARMMDAKMLALQRQGRIATFASVKGEEACQIGAMAALKASDWMVPSFREAAASIARGAPLVNLLLYVGGDERGSVVEGEQHDLPVSIPVGSQLCHAAGISLGMKLKKEKNVCLVFFGDGATSEGDFHESLNFASVFQAPCIFLCQNNQYAISVPVAKQMRSSTIAQKAIAYEMPGIQVDGNDVFAVYAAVKEAADRARKGGGPTLIECFTYRLENHTTSDDASRYRDKKEVAVWEKKDPILRLKNYLTAQKNWSAAKEKDWFAACEKQIEEAVATYEKSPAPSVEDMFQYMFASLTPTLQEQLAYAREHFS